MRETNLWTWHLLAGALILFLLGLHMMIMHLDGILGFMNDAGTKAVEWKNVLHRSQLAFFKINYVLLLAAGLYHGLYGLRTIIFELGPSRIFQKWLNLTFVVGGVALFALGTLATLAM